MIYSDCERQRSTNGQMLISQNPTQSVGLRHDGQATQTHARGWVTTATESQTVAQDIAPPCHFGSYRRCRIAAPSMASVLGINH